MYRLFYILTITFVLSSCYENQDGCLDVRARNYDISADVDCEDCCTYPSLIVSVYQYYNEEEFSLGDTLETNKGEEFVLLDYLYLLSDLELHTPDGVVTVLDSLALSGGESIKIKDDLFMVQRGVFQNTVGSFIYEGALSSLTLDYGIPEALDGRKISSRTNFMNSKTDSLYQGDEYIIHRLKVAKGVNLTDTVIYNIGQSYGRHNYEFFFDDAFSTRGDNLNIEISADYGFWFRNIDFSLPQSEVEAQLYINSKDFLF